MSTAEFMQLLQSLIWLLAGVGVFIVGMNFLSDALEKSAGDGMKKLLGRISNNRFSGVGIGAAVTAIIQSSSATSVMVIGLVNAGVMTLMQATPIIMGANIGTTITAWLLSLVSVDGSGIFMQMLKPKNFSLVLAMIGILCIMAGKTQKKKDLGSILLGFTVLMYGMNMMSGAVEPLKDMPGFADLFTKFQNPLLGVLVGAVLTAVIQSSSASVGILQALSLTGVITYSAAFPIIMGQNIGTCVTSVLSSIGTNRSARKVSIIHITFNLIGTVIFLIAYLAASTLIEPVALFFAGTIDPAGIAICHSVFNICTTFMLLPFSKYLVKIADRVIQEKASDAVDVKAELLDARVLSIPAMAVTACNTLTEHMAIAATYAVQTAIDLLDTYTEAGASSLVEGEETLDMYEDRVGQYLTQISGQGLSDHDSRQRFKMQHVIGDFERLGDHAMNLLDSAKEKQAKGQQFSVDAATQLAVLKEAINEILLLTCRAYQENNLELASQVEPLEQVIDNLIRQARSAHLKRLNEGRCTIEMGFVLADVLNNYEREIIIIKSIQKQCTMKNKKNILLRTLIKLFLLYILMVVIIKQKVF